MPHVSLTLSVSAAGRPLGYTTPPAPPEEPPTLARRIAELDALQIWLGVLGLWMCAAGAAQAGLGARGGHLPVQEPTLARPWIQLVISNLLHIAPARLPPLPLLPPPQVSFGLLLLCGSLLMLIASQMPAPSRRWAALLLALWAALQAAVAAHALADETGADGTRRLRFHVVVALMSLVCVTCSPRGSAPDASAAKPGAAETRSAAEVYEAEFRGTELTYS